MQGSKVLCPLPDMGAKLSLKRRGTTYSGADAWPMRCCRKGSVGADGVKKAGVLQLARRLQHRSDH
jgi:hypothetical protein